MDSKRYTIQGIGRYIYNAGPINKYLTGRLVAAPPRRFLHPSYVSPFPVLAIYQHDERATLAMPSAVAGTTPFSVMMPATSSAGVTSKAGFPAPDPAGITRTHA